jgi:menaquinone-dependent protoporphyrinogen oxidase
MTTQNVSRKSVSRRQFLKVGCLGVSAVGVAACGIGLAAPAPDGTPVELPSFNFGEEIMDKRILLAYASATGTTVGVAQAIAQTLSGRGFGVDVRPVKEDPQVEGYQAVLVGSAVQYGDWLPEAIEYVRNHQEALKRVPVGLFCVHIRNTANDEQSRRNRLAYLDKVRSLVRPVAEGFFPGRFNRQGAALMLPGLVARFIPTTDLRNWDKIRAWSQTVFA